MPVVYAVLEIEPRTLHDGHSFSSPTELHPQSKYSHGVINEVQNCLVVIQAFILDLTSLTILPEEEFMINTKLSSKKSKISVG